VSRSLRPASSSWSGRSRKSDEEVDALYRELLLEVELVQLEKDFLLLCLAKHADVMASLRDMN
jgi:hypothetical protein